LHSFRHLIALFGADRLFLESKLSRETFLPLLIVAKFAAASAAPVRPGSLEQDTAERALHRKLVAMAAQWLAELFPGDELKGHEAEKILADLASE
jgi:hypothetical protein